MGLLTAALLLGAGSAAMGAIDARKQRKASEREMLKNETEARENAKLNQTKDETGADIVLGSDATPDTKVKKKTVQRSAKAAGTPNIGTTLGGALSADTAGRAVGLR